MNAARLLLGACAALGASALVPASSSVAASRRGTTLHASFVADFMTAAQNAVAPNTGDKAAQKLVDVVCAPTGVDVEAIRAENEALRKEKEELERIAAEKDDVLQAKKDAQQACDSAANALSVKKAELETLSQDADAIKAVEVDIQNQVDDYARALKDNGNKDRLLDGNRFRPHRGSHGVSDIVYVCTCFWCKCSEIGSELNTLESVKVILNLNDFNIQFFGK